MNRKVAVAWLSLITTLIVIVNTEIVTDFTVTANASTIYVNNTGENETFTIIQDAIDNASFGDTVFVYNGTYYENIIVNKTINLTGENQDAAIIHGNWTGDVINLTVDWVNISGFTIKGPGHKSDDKWIELNNNENSTITNVTFHNKIQLIINGSHNYTLPDIHLSPYYSNITTPNITIVPYDQLNFSNNNLPSLYNIIESPFLDYTMYEIYSSEGYTCTIIIENARFFTLDNLFNMPNDNLSINLTYKSDNRIEIQTENTSYAPILHMNLYIILTERPKEPRNLSATPNETNIELIWEAPPPTYRPTTNYRIYRGTNPGEVRFIAMTGNKYNYTDLNLTSQVTYYYRINAVNINGNGPLSNEINATVLTSAEPIPGPPIKFRELPMWMFLLPIIITLAGLCLIVGSEIRNRKKKQLPPNQNPQTVTYTSLPPPPPSSNLQPRPFKILPPPPPDDLQSKSPTSLPPPPLPDN